MFAANPPQNNFMIPNPTGGNPTGGNPIGGNPMGGNPIGIPPAPYAQSGMINLGDQQVPAIWGEQLKQAIDGFHQLEWDIALQNMLKLIGIEQDRSEEVMEKAMSADFSQKNWDTQKGKEQVEYVRERCGKIRTKNLALMVRMMNLREKMVSQMYMYKSPSKPRALELSQMNEKIRDYKYQISLKHNQLKVFKFNRELNQEAEP